ncbi:MAG: transposase [bacterium]
MVAALTVAVEGSFRELRRSVRKTLVLVCTALVTVMTGTRSGAGRLSLAALYRVLPVASQPHSRENRLRRFLDNRRLEGRAVTTGLGRLLLARGGRGFWPVLIDQTKIGPVEVLIAAAPFAGRAVPLAVYTFAYPWREVVPSQNRLEDIFLGDLAESVPAGLVPVFVGDRGYCRARLLQRCQQEGTWLLVRGRAGTVVEYQGRRQKLRELPAPACRAVRYPDVRYHAQQRVSVDVVVYHDPAFAEPWHLLVPCWTRPAWTPTDVVDLYRRRMQIEQSFRDFKTHLGVRGLHLKARVTERLGRLLLAFCLAYAVLLILGVTPAGERARRDLEILRRQPRHGTRRTLSALSIAMMMLSHPRHAQRALAALCRLLARCARTGSVYRLPAFSFRCALSPPGN